MGMFILLMKNRTAVLNKTSVGSRLMLRNSAMSACHVAHANSSASQSSRLRPLPTTDKLRPLQLPPQRSVPLIVAAPHLELLRNSKHRKVSPIGFGFG